VLTRYLVLKIRAILLSPGVLGWAILFVLFWVVMWVYVFGGSLLEYRSEPWYYDAVRGYVSTMYASLSIISLGSIAVALTSSYASSSAAIRYVTRFTRLTSFKLVVEDTAANMAIMLIAAAIVVVASTVLSWNRFGVLVKPENQAGLTAILLLLGLFYHLLSTTLSYLILAAAGGGGFQRVMTILPLMLSFIPYALLFTNVGNIAAYLYPPIGLQALAVASAMGETPPATGLIPWLAEQYPKGSHYQPVSIPLTLLSTILWLVALALAAILLSRRVKAVRPEELRVA